MRDTLPVRVRLGVFELDLRAGELRQGDRTIRLQEKSFRVLQTLIEHRGELVARDEIQKKLWPNDTVVDFEHGINSAIKRLRTALGDSAENPKYIETLAGRGYRLMVPVEWIVAAGDPPRAVVAQIAGPADSAARVQPDPSALTGRTVSHYRVLDIIGGGGMGVVYRAEDLKLGRRVALKFLPEELGGDPQALERFSREARAVSSLDHPNICPIFEFGEHAGRPFMVMQMLEGQTLRDRLAAGEGSLPLEELLDIGIQVSDGLQAAHEQGIIHRDIKPANIFLTDKGVCKILDFGLAKLLEMEDEDEFAVSAGTPVDALSEPSGALHLTRTGAAMGTAGYMSPEQLRGEKLDVRTDLFSFGLVLYEMATGQRAFSGETAEIVHNAILHQPETPVHDLNSKLPPELGTTIHKALEKDRRGRYQTAAKMGADLAGVKRETTGRAGAVTQPGMLLRSRVRKWMFGVVVAVILLAAGVLYHPWKPLGLSRTSYPPVLPTHRQITFTGDAADPALSPDGKFIAYVTGKARQDQKLMLQDLEGGQTIELSKASAISHPTWSPDGAELAALLSGPPGRLQWGIFLIPRLGGPARFVARGDFLCWSPDGTQIAMAEEEEAGFRIVDKVTRIAKSVHLTGFRWIKGCDWSPASNLLAIWTGGADGQDTIWTVHPDGSQQSKVMEADELGSPHWSAAGDAIYFLRTSRGQTQDLLKVAINPKSGQAKDPASVLLNGLQVGSYFTVSAGGSRLACLRFQRYSNLWLAQFQSPDNNKQTGKELQPRPLTKGTSRFDSPSISPDGRWIAFVSQGHICKMPIEGGAPIQLTFSNATELSPAWSPDGKRIAFGSNEGGSYKVWIVDADGANRRQFVKTQLQKETGAQITWSPDRHILYLKVGNQNFNVLDPETGEEKPLVQSEVGWLFTPRYSPDGNNVAVNWNRPPQGGLWVISLIDNSAALLRAGYGYPAGWSPDGRSIYAYFGNKMMSIPAGTAGRGFPHTVFATPGDIHDASASADGKRFVFSVAETKSDVWLVENFDPAYRK